MSKCPIVPCALVDSFKPFDENSIKPVTVKLRYLTPMYYEEYKDMKKAIWDKVVGVVVGFLITGLIWAAVQAF